MNRKISDFHQNCVIILKNAGLSWNEISKELRTRYGWMITKRGMQKIYSRYLESGSKSDCPCSGIPRSISERSIRSIKWICLEDRMLSTIIITQIYNEYADRQISISSVQKILKKCSWNSYRAKKKPYLTGKQRQWMVSWAKDRVAWDVVKWSGIVYSSGAQTFSTAGQLKNYQDVRGPRGMKVK